LVIDDDGFSLHHIQDKHVTYEEGGMSDVAIELNISYSEGRIHPDNHFSSGIRDIS
jgi:hypothetical protein